MTDGSAPYSESINASTNEPERTWYQLSVDVDSEAVEAVWTEIYTGDQNAELTRLGEALTDVAELVWRWRNDHLVATRRAMGAKTGTGGSAGVARLEKRAQNNVFPELWTARSHV